MAKSYRVELGPADLQSSLYLPNLTFYITYLSETLAEVALTPCFTYRRIIHQPIRVGEPFPDLYVESGRKYPIFDMSAYRVRRIVPVRTNILRKALVIAKQCYPTLGPLTWVKTFSLSQRIKI
ncbi:MAG: hypothetical protein CEN91_251 [Candidatus Berkelbacteria bacterium Licking1014_85]|uniref:Uncharacterized protein n=1 Tax=Candidatus Berkelbacteria bacterium Licking1014_85 TaxID=2017148 RepID=A0A554LKA9_9BACT|nr:MAG: hypothetical protein CEN91_251 [Candidatus Berkelbacteria bacterium Licking1014_85]